jgi:hypothetical protein
MVRRRPSQAPRPQRELSRHGASLVSRRRPFHAWLGDGVAVHFGNLRADWAVGTSGLVPWNATIPVVIPLTWQER